LKASQRAWIRAEVSIGAQPLHFDENNASTAVSFKIHNIGNTPAIKITIHAWLIVLKEGGPFPWQAQLQKCDELRQTQIAGGFALFPDEVFPSAMGLGAYSVGISASQDDITKGMLVSGDKKSISLSVVGCIDYTFPTDPNTHHQTRFIYDLMRSTPAPIRPEEGNIPAASLRLSDSSTIIGREAD